MKYLILLLAITLISLCEAKSKSLIKITEENWKQVLKGQWMIKFHAPWCPACKDLAKTWDSFADWSTDLEIKVGEVDVTANPGLSGRFLVTALPTIYHVQNGVFRNYAGPRDKEDFMKFIEEKKWTVVDPLASWKYPDSFQMSVVAMFFRLSMHVRDLHNYFIEEKGLPAWASYAIFGTATLILGCILGFIIVCIIDFIFPAGSAQPAGKTESKKTKGKSSDKNKKSEDDGVRHRKGGNVNEGDENGTVPSGKSQTPDTRKTK